MRVLESKLAEWRAMLNAWEIPPEFEKYQWDRKQIRAVFSVLDVIVSKTVAFKAWEKYMEKKENEKET